MALQDIPVFMGHFKVMITETPAAKMKRNTDGVEVPATDREGRPQYVVTVFVKPVPREGGRKLKGEEVKVNLGPVFPGEDFEEGDYVELINPVVNTYELTNDQGRITGSGLWWKADGLKPMTRTASAPKAA